MPVSPAYRPEPRFFDLGEDYGDAVRAAEFPETRLRFRNDRAAATVGLDLTGILLLIVEELDPEPGGLSETLKALQALTPAQQREVQRFIEFMQYRDRQG